MAYYNKVLTIKNGRQSRVFAFKFLAKARTVSSKQKILI